ncbi:unnamed protein product [Diplocarpon coronariae]|uniref:ARID domain-containing protein n=1 Tax=Diplocarpon coronariae TaxID=2795749 RepID=A0A218Z923_9HELO|nr:hypothetical protein B2J93_1428 [Marssonina coronariae]
MSSWMNDQTHHGAGFNHLDPNASSTMLDQSAFINNHSSFDAAQFQNQQLQQRMQNGGMRNGSGSPALSNPQYQTNSVIPSKRPRPREESLGASPRQAPSMLPNSRSQTPSQPQYPGPFPQNNGTPQHAPQQIPYAHLQNGSANASPSPIMRPGGVPQRVSTASPHPFSPAGQQFPQASPSQSEPGRADTPGSGHSYAQNPPGFAQGFGQSFNPVPGRTSVPPQSGKPQMQPPHNQPPPMYQQSQGQPQPGQQRPPNAVEQQKMLYQQMQMQQQMQQRSMMAARQGNLPPGAGPMPKGPLQMPPNGQFAGMRPQQPQQPHHPPPLPPQSRGGPNPESFMKSLVSFMQQKQLPLDINPVVGDRQITLITLYMTVVKLGGHKKVSQANGWNQVAQAMQFYEAQHPNAAQQLRAHYERNLSLFEEAWAVNQQRHRAAMMQQNPNLAQQMSPTKPGNPHSMQPSPNFLQQPQMQQHHLQHPRDVQSTPAKHPHHAQQPSINGFATPQQPQGPHPMAHPSHSHNSLSRSVDVTPPRSGSAFAMLSPVQGTMTGSVLARPSDARHESIPPILTPVTLPDMLQPKTRVVDSYGGYELLPLANLGDALRTVRPDFPQVDELGAMGTVDIHALTMSLQSGIHSEVRLALDTLTALTMSNARLDMRQCEDLVETMIDCAEVQIDLLAENAAEVSDVMLISSYEEIARGCRLDHQSLRELPAFGSAEYELDRSVDRLICLTTILRNLSFEEVNHGLLADELVVRFLCVVIRYLGTRNMFLRTNQNTLDFMKDVITFLSNLAQSIELPGREQALCLIHFLLAFAPCPPPNTMGVESAVSFSSYDPAVHTYLPCAVDALAKLLARDEPNRTHYKTIFASDVASLPPFDLLTRTFGLAISTIPDEKPESTRGDGLLPVLESRKPSLMQGMLAAEILSNLAPGYETGVAKSWLTSEDGFSQKLGRLVVSWCLEGPPQAQHQRAAALPKGADDESLLHIITSGIVVLQRLAEKSKDPEDASSNIPLSGLPSKDSLLSALRIAHPRFRGVLRQLCAYSGFGT